MVRPGKIILFFIGKSMSGQPIATCSQCGVTFRSFSGLYHHQKTHEGQLYKCPEPGCNKEYKTEHLLRRHLKVHRDHREGNLKCPHCEKTFCRADYLEIHIKRHLGQKDEKCPECGKGKFFNSNFCLQTIGFYKISLTNILLKVLFANLI